MLCNNDNNAKYFTTFEDTFYPPHYAYGVFLETMKVIYEIIFLWKVI